jgi:hypothetical protein
MDNNNPRRILSFSGESDLGRGTMLPVPKLIRDVGVPGERMAPASTFCGRDKRRYRRRLLAHERLEPEQNALRPDTVTPSPQPSTKPGQVQHDSIEEVGYEVVG